MLKCCSSDDEDGISAVGNHEIRFSGYDSRKRFALKSEAQVEAVGCWGEMVKGS
jgi:hypothetical protein